jgi:hypothetical protein
MENTFEYSTDDMLCISDEACDRVAFMKAGDGVIRVALIKDVHIHRNGAVELYKFLKEVFDIQPTDL